MSTDDLRLDCYSNLMKLAWKIIRLSRQNLNSLGFAWNQYTVMKNINPGECITLSEISSRCFKENSNITALVDFLESKEIIVRLSDSQDRRITRVKLTEQGEITRREVITKHQDFIKKMFGKACCQDVLNFTEIIKTFQGYIT
jgi:DNA-binding MarR family transcriptional regulator